MVVDLITGVRRLFRVVAIGRRSLVGVGALVVVTLGISVNAQGLGQREHLFIVGSSTNFPIISAVAERFTRSSTFASPVVESTGTGGGFKSFCAGVGARTPDIAMASREIKGSERQQCEKNGVTEIVPLKIGYGGIVVVHAAGQAKIRLRRVELYLALAKRVPNPHEPAQLILNPYTHWDQINPELPELPILVYGPPPTSGTRDILVENVIEAGCRTFPSIVVKQQTAPDEYRQDCYTLREDGAYVDAGENDMRLVRKLVAEPKALGIIGYNFLERNIDKLQATEIEGSAPTFEAIESGRYPISRPLYLYVKKAHFRAIRGLREFVTALTEENAWGPDGYMSDQGLIPLSDNERSALRSRVMSSLDP